MGVVMGYGDDIDSVLRAHSDDVSLAQEVLELNETIEDLKLKNGELNDRIDELEQIEEKYLKIIDKIYDIYRII
jgi:hypothetical protein